MHIMTKRGRQDNIVTYEHYCDSVADLQQIEPQYVTLGSVAIIVDGEEDSLSVYIANSHKEWISITTINGSGGSLNPEDVATIVNDWLDNHPDAVLSATSATAGQVPVADGEGSWAWGTSGGGVSDVQVNSTSVVTNGVANVPVASSNVYGAVSLATANNIKAGATASAAIQPGTQHRATFYGLAKAAGDTTQSQSDNPVGTYTDDAKAAIQQMLGVPSNDDIPTVPVQDIQIDSTSIVDGNGVANVPIAGSNPGVVSLDAGNGFGLSSGTTKLRFYEAASSVIKTGTSFTNPIVPGRQHESTFYGLAKAAGDSTQSASSNAVGTYTDTAKAAIQNMLGVVGDGGYVQSVSGTTPTINGIANVRYECGEVSTITINPPVSGTIDVIFTSGSSAALLTLPNTVLLPSWFVASNLDTNTIYEIMITDATYGSVMTWDTVAVI